MQTWSLHVLEYARSHQQPWVDLVSGMARDGAVDLPFSFCLARAEGRVVLVDTGFMQEGTSSFSRKFGVPNWVSPVRMLREAGVAAAEVTDIVLTHCHFDHMGSVAEFPNAMIHIQKSELLSWYEAFALPKRFRHLTTIVDPDNIRAALEASFEFRIDMIDGDRDDVLPGIHVRLASGHTIGQQFVVVETAAGRRVISGDCLYNKCQLTGHGDSGIYVPLNNAVGSVWEQLKSLDKLNDEIGGDLRNLVILHDPDRWQGLPVEKEVEGFRIVRVA
jgi:glyoxylase-like metal-dependent hydrolase (beta-lactamase superfamily II)